MYMTSCSSRNILLLADRIASEQQKLANKYLHHDEESDPAEELENSVARSKKYTEKNLFPHG